MREYLRSSRLFGGALVALLTVGTVVAQRADGPAPQDIAAQNVQPVPNMPAADASFDGLSSQDNQDAYGTRFNPPNTNGDVGPNDYVQVVNSLVRIFNKDGTPNSSKPTPFKMSSLLASATPALPGGSLCLTHDDGEGSVVYDQLAANGAGRWLLAQVAFTSPTTPPYHLCVAVSQTPDPAGAYFAYDFVMPGNNLPGNVKFGVWPDGYYMADNQYLNGSAFSGAGVFAFDRAKMLAGNASATFIYFNLANFFAIGAIAGGMLPADFDGSPATAPPAGAPSYFAMLGPTPNLFGRGGATNTMRLFAFHADFAAPSNSTFVEGPESPVVIAAYDARAPGGQSHIEQPSPAASDAYLDSAQGRLMQRLAYRRFTTAIAGPNGSSVAPHESLVMTHTVNVGPNPLTVAGHQSAIRYYEFERPLAGGPFAEIERTTFAPDTDNRWMGSAAMDGQGNLVVGYNVSGPNTFPSIRYAGRLGSDLRNGLYQGEAELVAGSGVQLATSGAWGGSSSMTVDPDDCRFWYTNQYYTAASQASSSIGWVTRIGSFKFPGCNGPAGTIKGTVTDITTTLPIANALVTMTPGGTTSRTDTNGVYMRSLAPGTYTVAVSATTYATGTASGVNVASGVTTPKDFALTFTGGTLTGHVLNAATSAPVANARVTITPGDLRATTDANGLYTKAVEPGTYTVAAEADDFLALAAVSGVPVTSGGTTTQDFALAPVVFAAAVYDTTLKVPACGAGTSGCDSGALLLGRDTIAGGAEPHQPNTILNSCADGTLGAFHVDESIDRLKVSTIDGAALEMGRTVQVSATVWARYAGGLDKLDLYYASNVSGSTWTFLTTLTPPSTGSQTLSATYVLPAGDGQQAVRARFRFQGTIAACTGGAGNFSDQDDLVFGVNVAPIITTQPISQTVVTGQTAAFSVVASATPAPTYQWQLSTNNGTSWTNVTNAAPYNGVTTATLQVANTTPAQSGFQYRAVVNNGLGSVTSAAATLTVTTPVLSLTPTVQDFGSVFTGSSTSRTFTIQNTGNGTLTGSASLVSTLGTSVNASRSVEKREPVKPVVIDQIERGADALARELDGQKYVDGRLLVRFRNAVANGDKASAHALAGSQRLRAFGGVSNLELVRLAAGMSVKQALQLYRQLPDVLYAEPDYMLTTTALPNDPQFGDLWGLRNTGQAGGTSGVDIRATQAWDITTGSSNVVVAVIDTGIDYNHPDLAANMFRNTADCNTNGVDDDGNGFIDDCFGIDTVNNDSDPMDDVGHGTHTAGTIGAVGNNGIGVAGVNWNVRLMSCKFLGQSGGSTSGALACLDYIKTMKDRGVNIVATNNSWGGGGFSQALYDAIDVQRQRGILFIASAGNAASNNDVVPAYPANYDLPNVISVAATTRTDALASFSDYGRRTVHLGAPGQDILSTTPNNSYSTFSGTSMAAPHVTGVAALLKAQDPTRDWRAIKNLILAGGIPTTAMANTITGRRLDALNALTCSGRTVLSRLQPASSTLIASIGVPLTLSALHITCANPNGNITVAVSPGGSTITLGDDGGGGDQASGDGIYSAQWTPAVAGSYTLTFPGGDVVTVAVPSDYTVQAAAFSYRVIAGTNLNLTDDSAASITSPFPILFGGNASLTGLFVNSNGNISVGAGFTNPFNESIPTAGVSTMMAALWDDLNPAAGTANNVFWAVSGSAPDRELVVEWRDVEVFGCTGGTVKFQVVFFEGSSNILFNYADTTVGGSCAAADHGGSATVGMQISSGRAQQFSLNQASVNDGTSLLWTVGAASPFSIISGGTFALAPAASQVLTVRFAPQAAGTATGTLTVASNGGTLPASLTGAGTLPPPAIITHPGSQMVTAGQDASFSVLASGSPSYQWQSSANGGVSWTNLTNTAPYSGVTSATLAIASAPQPLNATQYRAVATNGTGSATSNAATLTVIVFAAASYDSSFKAPVCAPGASGCDSGALLVGRWLIINGVEPNQPNTIHNTCEDGIFGTFHVQQSNDRIRISTVDGAPFADGKMVRVEATVWATFPGFDFLDLYSTSNPSATTPTWTYVTTLTASVAGAQTLSATYVLPSAGLQAVRARFRFLGSPAPCTGNASSYDDHDDLIFNVQSTAGTITGHVTNTSASPIANAEVSLSPGGLTATTDTTGLYTMSAAAGTYTMTVSSADFLPVSFSVLVTTGATTTKDATLAPVVYTQAVYDGTLKAPKCGVGVSGCDSGTLLVGRDSMLGGAEPNQPNTILSACADGTLGSFHFDESNDRLRISTTDGTALAAGKTVRISATVWVFSVSDDFLDLFYTSNASAASPTWTYLTTLTPSGGNQTLQTLTTTATLQLGSLQAVRARFRFTGAVGACSNSTATYDDHDDLVFTIPTAGVPAITSQPASQSLTAGQATAFTVAASGTPAPTYQWQLSINGGASFLDLTNAAPFSGVTTPTLTLTGATPNSSGYQFRALATNSVGSAASTAATLTVVSGAAFTTLAGSGGHNSIDGTGSAARFFVSWGVAVDSNGDAYVADANSHTIRKVTAAGVVTTVAGLAGTVGSLDGSASGARFNFPRGLAIDSLGTLYIADASNHTIRKMTAAGVVTTLAGSAGNPGSTDGPASDARFNFPYGVAVDAAGAVYVAEVGNDAIRKIAAGVVTTLAGLAGSTGSTDGTGSAARFRDPEGIAVDAAGTLYVADSSNNTVRRVSAGGVVTTLAGLAGNVGSADGTGTAARFNFPVGVAVNSTTGTVYVADQSNFTIRAVITASGAVTTLAGTSGSFGTVDGTGSAARFYLPRGVGVASDGTLYATDSGNDMVRTISPAGVVTTVAGVSSFGNADGTSGAAKFFFPRQVAVDASGTVYVADSNNHTVRKITAAGVVTTLAGLAGSSGSADGTGGAARFNTPSGVAVDNSTGTVYVADTNNHTIRQITAAGVVTTFAGSAGTLGAADGAGINARFNFPRGLALDQAAGMLYVADTSNHTIRKITAAGVVTTHAGTAGSSGSLDGTGSAARFFGPNGVAVDGAGTVYVGDTSNNTIRKITGAGVVTTLAGTAGSFGNLDGTGTIARFGAPTGVAVDSVGTVYVADTGNNMIRTVTAAGVVTTLAGLAGVTGNTDGAGGSVRFYSPNGIAVDSAGTIFVGDTTNSNIRKGTP